MRISDWSSDVCSSDLIASAEQAGRKPDSTQLQLLASCALKQNDMNAYRLALEKVVTYTPKPDYWLDLIVRTIGQPGFSNTFDLDTYRLRKATGAMGKGRSEEHTSELQSLMRSSYAVFCLKKKTTI